LALQLRRRKSTGHSYPFSAPASSATPGMRLQCTYQPAHLPPCYNRAMPYSKVCHRHILEDKHQVLYKRCAFAETGQPACEVPIYRSAEPPYCETHVKLADFIRNPRLSRPPPEPSQHKHNRYERGGFDARGSGGGFDGDAFEGLEDFGAGMDEFSTGGTDALGLDDYVINSDMLGGIPEDESKELAELQSSLMSSTYDPPLAGTSATATIE
jgi:hypothetical protein